MSVDVYMICIIIIFLSASAIGLEFVKEPSDVTVLAGNAVTLHCTPPHSVPPASVTWYKDYTPFVQRTGMFAATVIANGAERNLHFSSVQESDEGAYYCVASNSYSVPTSRTSTIAQLTVRGNCACFLLPQSSFVFFCSYCVLYWGVMLLATRPSLI